MPLASTLEADDLRLARVLKALSNPTRLAIVRWLVGHPQCITGDIVEVAGLAQSTVSGHLAVLRDAGLVCGTVSGPATCYCLDRGTLAWLETQVAAFLGGLRSDSPVTPADSDSHPKGAFAMSIHHNDPGCCDDGGDDSCCTDGCGCC